MSLMCCDMHGCLKDMISALEALHHIGYLHCDISPANILFNQLMISLVTMCFAQIDGFLFMNGAAIEASFVFDYESYSVS